MCGDVSARAATLFFACKPHHKRVSEDDWETVVTDTGRLAWTDGTKSNGV